jgi:prepilin-type N-terminal cleavage/methylation domain-containing protein
MDTDKHGLIGIFTAAPERPPATGGAGQVRDQSGVSASANPCPSVSIRGSTALVSPHGNVSRRAGFTLVEMMVGAALSSFILAGVLSTFLFMGRTGANIRNYSDMESQARRALEQFAQDVRQASAVSWTNDTTIVLTVDGASVTYAYSSGSFTRRATTGTSTLLSGITSFSFKAYSITGAEITGIGTTTTLASANLNTKQLQISLEAARSSTTVATATNTVLSARFILRNKRVTT